RAEITRCGRRPQRVAWRTERPPAGGQGLEHWGLGMGGVDRRVAHERGAALVEMALILPLLLMLLLGIVSAGLAYNHQLALTHATREAGRHAATLPVDSMSNWLATVEARVISDATGSLDTGTPGRYTCVAYVHPNGATSDDSTTRIENGVVSGGHCF